MDTVINYNSGGGSLTAAYGITSVLLSLQEKFSENNNRLFSYVDNGAICASACLLTYAAIPERFAHETSRFGFHSPTFAGIPDVGLRKDYLNQFANSGINKQWIENTLFIFLPIDITWYRPLNLLTENTGFISNLDNIISNFDTFLNDIKNTFAVEPNSNRNKICNFKTSGSSLRINSYKNNKIWF